MRRRPTRVAESCFVRILRPLHFKSRPLNTAHSPQTSVPNRLSLLPMLRLLPLLGGRDLWEVPAAHLDDGA